MIEKVLESLGLTDKEVAIYLALLPLGNAPASALGNRTGINRSTAQYICQQLTKKGIIRSLQKNNTFIYSPESPEKLLYLIDQEKKVLEEKTEQTNRIIGQLKGMINPQAVLPKVKFFEGVDGLIEMFEDALTERKTLYGAAKLDNSVDERMFKYVTDRYVPERIKLKFQAFMLFNDDEMSKQYQQNDTAMNRISMLMPLEEFPFESSCHIYGDKVAYYSWHKNDLSGVIIQNTHIHNTALSIFKAAWRYAKTMPANKKHRAVEI